MHHDNRGWHAAGIQLYGLDGERLYLDLKEREQFITTAWTFPDPVRELCLTYVLSGVRASEGLSLSEDSLHPRQKMITVRTLKKPRKHSVPRLHIRQIPFPPEVMELLVALAEKGESARLFPYGRTWAWMRVKEVMAAAGIEGARATIRALRRTFAVHADQCLVPLNFIKEWLGHEDIHTTAGYTHVLGHEQLTHAERMWQCVHSYPDPPQRL